MSIPKGWEEVRLGDICDIYDGTHQTPKYVENGIPFLSVENITNNNFDNTKFISEEEHKQLTKKVKIQKNDILMTRIGTLGVCKLVDWDFEASYYVSLALLRVKQGVLPLFLAQYADSSYFLNEVKKRSLLLATPPKINLGDISDIKIKLPPLKEQVKIAEILSSCDEHIKNLKNLKSELEKEKLHLMNELLSGKTRFANFTTPWQEVTLGDVLKETSERNKIGIDEVLSVTNKMGFVSQEEYFSKTIASKDTSNYKIIKRGEFGYNPARINVGSIAKLKHCEIGILSPMYVVFKCLDNVSNIFMDFWLQSILFTSQFDKYLSGSVRMTLSFSDMKLIKIKLPSLEEQKKIGEVLSACDERLECLNELITAQTILKSHLLTELLSGNIRVDI